MIFKSNTANWNRVLLDHLYSTNYHNVSQFIQFSYQIARVPYFDMFPVAEPVFHKEFSQLFLGPHMFWQFRNWYYRISNNSFHSKTYFTIIFGILTFYWLLIEFPYEKIRCSYFHGKHSVFGLDPLIIRAYCDSPHTFPHKEQKHYGSLLC